jgi:ATP-dependent Lon protease
MATTPVSSRSLPLKPNAEYLRKEAKRLARVEAMQLAAAQRRLAHKYGYRNWAELIIAIQAMASPNGGSPGANDPDDAGATRKREGTPNVFPLLPLRGLVAFPHSSYPIFLGRTKSIKAAAYAHEHTIPILLVTQRDQRLNDPSSSDMYEVGTVAAVVEKLSLPDGTMKSVVEGMGRARVHRFIFNEEFYKAEAEPIEEPTTSDTRLESVTGLVLSAFMRERLRTTSTGKNQVEAFGVPATRADGAAALADTIASESRIDLASKQTLLEILDPLERLQRLLAFLNASD